MNSLSGFFVIVVLTLGLVSAPLSLAQTNENGTDTVELEDSVKVSVETNDESTEQDNGTNTTIELEESLNVSTKTTDESTEQETNSELELEISKNLGQQVSNFVHESRDLFKQQKEETKATIALCRENLRNAEPSERKSVREQCREDLDEIKESYHTIRETYYDAFKSFRENMKVFIKEAKGLSVDDDAKKEAIVNIESLPDNSEKRNIVLELKQKMREEIREEKQNKLEQLKKERELERKSLKAEREAKKEQFKAEREEMKKSLKAEKENREEKNSQNDDVEISERSENELKVEVEVEDGIAKIKIESDSEFEFEMDWTDKQTVIAEISSRTGLSISEIESVVEFDIEDEADSEQDE